MNALLRIQKLKLRQKRCPIGVYKLCNRRLMLSAAAVARLTMNDHSTPTSVQQFKLCATLHASGCLPCIMERIEHGARAPIHLKTTSPIRARRSRWRARARGATKTNIRAIADAARFFEKRLLERDVKIEIVQWRRRAYMIVIVLVKVVDEALDEHIIPLNATKIVRLE